MHDMNIFQISKYENTHWGENIFSVVRMSLRAVVCADENEKSRVNKFKGTFFVLFRPYLNPTRQHDYSSFPRARPRKGK